MAAPIETAPTVFILPYDGPFRSQYTKKYDYDVDGNLIYEGWAAVGSATSAAVWSVKKYVYSTSNLTSEVWADGNVDSDNIWDNRTSLTYS